MVQRGRRTRLLLEAVEPVGVGGKGGREDLDGDVPAEARVARAIDLAHAAGADERDDLIRAEAGAGRECHGTKLILWGSRRAAKPAGAVRANGAQPPLGRRPDGVQCAHALFHRRNQRMARRIALRFAFTGFLILTAAAASPQPPGGQQPPPINPNAIVPGEFVVEPPTLINLGFEWFIEGDDNRNAAVDVSYRKQGETAWKHGAAAAAPAGRADLSAESRVDVVAPNMFAGSILDLEPDTRLRGAVRDDRSGRRHAARRARR